MLFAKVGLGQTLTLLNQYSTTSPNCGQVEFYVVKSPGSTYTKFNIAYSTNGGLTFNNYFFSTPQTIALYNGLPISISGPDQSISFTGIYRAVFTNGSTNASTVTENSNEIQVTINPVASIANVTRTICSGGSFSVAPTNGDDIIPTGTTYSWSAPSEAGITGATSGSGATSIVGTLVNTTNAVIDVVYSVTPLSGSCSGSSFTVTVTVNPNTSISTQPTGYSVCAGGTSTALSVVATGTGTVTYQWFSNTTNTNSGGVSIGSATNASYSPPVSTAGTYYYYVEATSSCSSAKSNAVAVTIKPLPTVTATSTPLSGAVCIGDNATLNGGGAASYTWSGGVTNGTAFTPTTTTTYTVTGTDANGCVNTATKLVTVTSLPTAAAIVAPANKVIVNKTLALTAAASGGTSPYNFIWTPNPTMNYSISGQENAVFNALKEGKVNIKYQVKDANNCEANSADFEITIEPEEIVLVLPNAFTPNGDGINDEFKIVASNLLGKNSFRYFEIYNRNGKLMKRVDNISGWWDGIYNNVIQDMGVYFVKLVKLNKDGQLVADNLTFYLLK